MFKTSLLYLLANGYVEMVDEVIDGDTDVVSYGIFLPFAKGWRYDAAGLRLEDE